MSPTEKHSAALAAFDDILPLLHQTARIVKDCPFNDPTDRVDLAVLVASYFVGSAMSVMDADTPGSRNPEKLLDALTRVLADSNAERKGKIQ